MRFALVGLALVACAKPPVIENPSPFDEDDPSAIAETEAQNEPDENDSGYALDPPDLVPSAIDQEALLEVLDRGPAAYSKSVMIEAVLVDGALRGWKVTRWDVAWPGLRRGDVVVDVNGVVIQKPDDLMALWDILRQTSEIAIRLESESGEEIRRFAVR